MKLWIGALDLLFPPKCPFCQQILEMPRGTLCPDCQQKLPWLQGEEGERKIDFAHGCYSPLEYRKQVVEAVHRYKFAGVRAYAQPFGTLMAQCARDHGVEAVDGVTWTPLSRKRRRERGFDQAELLARQVGKELSLPVISVLAKNQHTQPQSSLDGAAARRANALGAYELLPRVEIAGKRLLLVDDVVTSGATLSECARLLYQAEVQNVYCLTLAQAGRGAPNQPDFEENRGRETFIG